MQLKIGEVIKKLRKKRNITQETLAEYLGISFQAISKWENGTALPDITLVPPLANFFGVSIDEIFGVEDQQKDQKAKEYETEYERLLTRGDVRGITTLMRKALEEYPHDFQFMLKLSHALTNFNSFNASKEQQEESIREAVGLCETILDDCNEDPIRYGALEILCNCYTHLGNIDKALKLAANMPSMELCKESLLERLLQGEERINQTQENILKHVDAAANGLIHLSFDKQMGKGLSNEQKVIFVEAANKLYESILPDDNLLFFNRRMAWNYRRLAELWCEMGNNDMALDCLESAAKYAEKYDNLPEESQYTSVLVGHCKFRKAGTTKNWVGTESGMLYYRMMESVFDNDRDNPKFKVLVEKLRTNDLPR